VGRTFDSTSQLQRGSAVPIQQQSIPGHGGRFSPPGAFHHSYVSELEVEIAYDAASRSVRMRDNGTGNNPKILSTGKQVGTEGDLTIPAKAAYARNPKPSP
jgi:hypothetical protein